jgi:hypothetical protein
MGHGHLIVECEVRLVGSRWKRLDGFCHQSDVRVGLTKDDGLIKTKFLMFESAAMPRFQTLNFGFY